MENYQSWPEIDDHRSEALVAASCLAPKAYKEQHCWPGLKNGETVLLEEPQAETEATPQQPIQKHDNIRSLHRPFSR